MMTVMPGNAADDGMLLDGWDAGEPDFASAIDRAKHYVPSPELIAANPKAVVYVTEGEKDADRLAMLGLVVTTNPGGCRIGWKSDYTPNFAGRHVVVLADNDKPGARHSERVEQSLRSTAGSVAILKLPRLRRADDVSDWLDYRRGTPEEPLKLVRALVQQPVNGVSARKPPKGHGKRHSIFLSVTLTPTERLLLLAIQHYAGTPEIPTAGDLAAATGLHRVSVQRLIASLTQRSILSRKLGRLEIDWRHVV